jgi:hypothetical protein
MEEIVSVSVATGGGMPVGEDKGQAKAQCRILFGMPDAIHGMYYYPSHSPRAATNCGAGF